MMSFIRNAAIVVGGALGGGCASTQHGSGPQEGPPITNVEAPEGVVLGQKPAPTPPAPQAAPVAQPAAAPVTQPEPAQGPAAGRMDATQDLSAATMPPVPQQPAAAPAVVVTPEEFAARRAELDTLSPLVRRLISKNNDGYEPPDNVTPDRVHLFQRDLSKEFTTFALGDDALRNPAVISNAALANGIALAQEVIDLNEKRNTDDRRDHKLWPATKKNEFYKSAGRERATRATFDELEVAIGNLEAWHVEQAEKLHPTATPAPVHASRPGGGAASGAVSSGAGYDGHPLNGDQIAELTGFTPSQLLYLSKGQRNALIYAVVDVAKMHDLVANPPTAKDAQKIQENQLKLSKMELDLASRQEDLKYDIAKNEVRIQRDWAKLDKDKRKWEEQQRHKEVKNIEDEIGGALGLVLKGIKVWKKF